MRVSKGTQASTSTRRLGDSERCGCQDEGWASVDVRLVHPERLSALFIQHHSSTQSMVNAPKRVRMEADWMRAGRL